MPETTDQTLSYADVQPPEVRAQYPPAWEDVADLHQQAFPDLNQKALQDSYEQQRQMGIARIIARQQPEENANRYVERRSLPFLTQGINLLENKRYHEARQRIEQKQASTGDYHILAEHEEQQRREEAKGFGGKMLSALAGVPAMAGEALAGGMALKGAASLAPRALGFLAPEVAAGAGVAVPAFLSGAGIRNALARNAAQTLLMPSMYMERAAENNSKQGRAPLDPAGFPAALGLGMIQTAVLGQVAGRIPSSGLKGLAARAGAGMLEQQAGDVASSTVAKLIPAWSDLDTRYGLLGEFLDGRKGEAAQHAAIQFATFAAFGLLHGAKPGVPASSEGGPNFTLKGEPYNTYGNFPREPPPARGALVPRQPQGGEVSPYGQTVAYGIASPPPPVLLAFRDLVNNNSARRLPLDHSVNEAREIADQLHGLLEKNPHPLREDVAALFNDLPDGPRKRLGLAVADAFPAGLEGPPPGTVGRRMGEGETNDVFGPMLRGEEDVTPLPPAGPAQSEPTVEGKPGKEEIDWFGKPPEPDQSGPGEIKSDLDTVTEALGPAVKEVPLKGATPPIAPEAPPKAARSGPATGTPLEQTVLKHLHVLEEGNLEEVWRHLNETGENPVASKKELRGVLDSLKEKGLANAELAPSGKTVWSPGTEPAAEPKPAATTRDEKILQLKHEGLTHQEIADQIGLSKGRVGQILNEQGWTAEEEKASTVVRLAEKSKGTTPEGMHVLGREPVKDYWHNQARAVGMDTDQLHQLAQELQRQGGVWKLQSGGTRPRTQADHYQEAFYQLADQESTRAATKARQAGIASSRIEEVVRAAESSGVSQAEAEAAGAVRPAEPATEPAPGKLIRPSEPFLAGEGGFLNIDVVKEYGQEAWERVKSAARHFRDNFAELAGQMGPRTSRLSRLAGEALAHLNAVPVYVREHVPGLIDKVLGENSTREDRKLYGAAITEMHLRHTRDAYRQRAQAAAAAGNTVEAVEASQHAANVTTVLGRDSPIKDEAHYQRVLQDPKLQEIIASWKRHMVPEMEANFRMAQGMEDTDPIHSFTQIPDFPVNLKGLAEGETADDAVVKTEGGRGNLKGTHQGKLLFANERKGNAGAYDVDLGRMIEHSIRHGYSRAQKANLFRVAQEQGVGRFGTPGDYREGEKEIPHVFPPRGTQEAEAGQSSFFVKEPAYDEFRRALKVDQPVDLKTLKPINDLLTKSSLASTVEFVYHGKNLLTFLFKPGVSPAAFIRNVIGVVRGDRAIRDRLEELARIGALKGEGAESGLLLPEKYKKLDPTYWAGATLDVLQRGMRLAGEEAFDKLAGKLPGMENTETAKRDFLNQLGQYNKQAQQKAVRLLRDTGFGPFATAGSNYWVQGWRAMYGEHGLKTRDWSTDIRLRAETMARILGVAGATAAMNYLLWKRADGDDKTPLGALKLQEEGGKSIYVDLTNLTGLTRGMRQTGLLAMLEGERREQGSGKVIDRATENILHGLIHPALGPLPSFAWTAASGKNTLGIKVAEKPPLGGSEAAQNLKAAVSNFNPTYATLAGADKPKKQETVLPAWTRLLGPFTPRESGQEPVVRNYYDRLHDLEDHRRDSPERKKGLQFPQEAEYLRLHAFRDKMDQIAMLLKGERKLGSRVVEGSKPDPEQAARLREVQIRLARQALSR